MFKTFIALALACAHVSANRSQSFVDKFDGALGVVPPASLIKGTAGGALYYQTFEYFDASQSTVNAQSTPNVATYGAVTEAQNGQPAWFPINKTIDSFNQQSLYYGCVSNTVAAAAAISCTLQLSAVRSDGITVVQELIYNPNTAAAKNPLAFATFPSVTFSNLKNVSIQVLQAPVSTSLISPVFDNNAYTANYKS